MNTHEILISRGLTQEEIDSVLDYLDNVQIVKVTDELMIAISKMTSVLSELCREDTTQYEESFVRELIAAACAFVMIEKFVMVIYSNQKEV